MNFKFLNSQTQMPRIKRGGGSGEIIQNLENMFTLATASIPCSVISLNIFASIHLEPNNFIQKIELKISELKFRTRI